HLLPVLLLLVALAGVTIADAFSKSKPPEVVETPTKSDFSKHGFLVFTGELRDTEPRIDINFSGDHRFGIVMRKERDPKNPEKSKKLTYQEDGSSNNTCVIIDGDDSLFGLPPGKLARRVEMKKPNPFSSRVEWEYPSGIRVIQFVQLVPGAQSGAY